MKGQKTLFSAQRGDWRTPVELYAELDKEFHFDFDPCPSNPTFDGLKVLWGLRNFVNPPYGPAIRSWLEMALHEREIFGGCTSVFLLPARTDTKWFHELVLPNASEIRFIKGRLHFDGAKGGAPFPSMIVVFA